MMTPRFTVVIPTRERCDTLEWALKTCVTQDYDNLEILVSDNNSADRTEEVVRSFNDPRIRYINTGRRLSMSENFEYALSHTGEGYINFIGDDDGLLPNAVTDIAGIVAKYNCRALIWPVQAYYWPGYIEAQFANTLFMNPYQDAKVREVSSASMLHDVSTFRRHYQTLPSLYFGFVHQDVVRAIKQRSGNFWHSITPDVYAGVAIASVLDSYHISSRAYSLVGVSRHSNGASQLSGHDAVDPHAESARFVKENTIPFHERLVYAPSAPILVAEAFLQVRDHLGPQEKLKIDMRDVIKAALVDQNVVSNPPLQRLVIEAIKKIAVLHGLGDYTEKMIRQAHSRRYPRALGVAARHVLQLNPVFDCAPYGVKNVYDASKLFQRLALKYRSFPARQLAMVKGRATKAKRTVEIGVARTIGSQARK
jgi:hypothetical protein